jgi:hypothetical protein
LGCNWLRFRWLEIRAKAETGFLQGLDRLKGARLLGRQPVDALEDERVATIFVASDAIHAIGEDAFAELGSELCPDQLGIYSNEVMARWPDLIAIEHEAEGREALIKLVDQQIEHLDELLKAHVENADAVAERTIKRLRMDESPMGKSIRDYQLKCTSAYYRGLEACRKYKTAKDQGRVTSDLDPPRRKIEELRAADPRWQVADDVRLTERDDSDHGLGADIQRNDANEANFCENMITTQLTEPVDVMANSGPDLGLDKGDEGKAEISSFKSQIANRKTEGSESEIRESKSETANRELKIENSSSASPDLRDRVAGGRKRSASAKREKKRARREKARKELERRLSHGMGTKAGEAPDGELVRSTAELSPKMAEIVRRQFSRPP